MGRELGPLARKRRAFSRRMGRDLGTRETGLRELGLRELRRPLGALGSDLVADFAEMRVAQIRGGQPLSPSRAGEEAQRRRHQVQRKLGEGDRGSREHSRIRLREGGGFGPPANVAEWAVDKAHALHPLLGAAVGMGEKGGKPGPDGVVGVDAVLEEGGEAFDGPQAHQALAEKAPPKPRLGGERGDRLLLAEFDMALLLFDGALEDFDARGVARGCR